MKNSMNKITDFRFVMSSSKEDIGVVGMAQS